MLCFLQRLILKANDKNLTSHILVCRDLELAYETLLERYSDKNYKLFLKNSEKESKDFLLEDAKNVVKEAYVAESDEKIIILGAKSYNIYAQNSLLKILEEPPRNIIFILVCESKNVFLPTIRSRLLLKELVVDKQIVEIDLDLSKMDLQELYNFVQKNSRVKKNELKELVQKIITQAILNHNISFNTKELEHFERLLQLAELNSRPTNILISLLLTILEKRA